MSGPDTTFEETDWQQLLIDRWGDFAWEVIGYWNSLSLEDKTCVSYQQLDSLCRELELVPYIVEVTELSWEAIIHERIACSNLPRKDRLVGWLGAT